MKLEPARPQDAPAMASAHAQAFESSWDEMDFEDILDGPGVFGFVAWDGDPAGVVICRTVESEAEVLTVGVAGWARRRGLGQALMAASIGVAQQAGATEMFLEVGVDNMAALALYEGLGFVRAGLRKDYYDRGAQGRADALVMRLDLTSRAL